MAVLTERENLYRMYRGEMPAFLPQGGFRDFKCSRFVDVKKPGYHVDEFGVEYIGKEGVFGGTPLPMPGKYVLHDIRRWRDVIRAPDLSDVDWAALAARDLKEIDTQRCGIEFYWGKIFQRICDFMGFEEGLCAIMEEPEEVYALFDYLCSFYERVLKEVLYHYRPDAVCIPDDTATARAPFLSKDCFRRLVLPFYRRIAELVHNSGVFLEKHDCGRCEDFIDDWVEELGVVAWNPAQPSNDLVGIKKKYGRRLIISGGWDSQGPESFAETDDSVMLEALHRYVDTLAPGGGFLFSAYVSGEMDDPNVKRKFGLIQRFYNEYAKGWYDSHG